MIAAGEHNGLVQGFICEIGDQLKNTRFELFLAAAATEPKVPPIHRNGAAALRQLWRDSRSKIMAAMADAF
jgi:hypothetical protein